LPTGFVRNQSSGRKKLWRNTVAKMRKTEKTVEIHEFYIIRSASGSLPSLCGACAAGDAIMVTPEHAAAVANVPVRMIYRWVETGVIHYQEVPDGSLTVCVKSLLTMANRVGGA
jgi:hypothetical protein